MSDNRGKAFEKKFAEDFLKIKDASLDRLIDVMSGYKYISNISDYIGYVFPNIYYLELKSIQGNTFPLSNLTQYDKLLAKVNIKGVRTGVIIWFRDHDRVVYVPIATITKLKTDNKKSVNITTVENEGYRIINIPSTKKRVFLDSDYSVLTSLVDGD